ncbi:MAG: ADOP family duplicated permease [Candidatus Didemnitutus sp.]|nr:ADOP family duplicated permease [Candidatus Didemnitutus sp.]
MNLRRRLRSLFRRREVEAEMAEEMRQHLEQRAADLAADGLAPAAARLAAQRRFGNTASLQEHARDSFGWRWLENFAQDLRLGARLLLKSPGFTTAAVAVLALGIGVNTAMFSVQYAIGFSARPFSDPGRVVQLYSQSKIDAADFQLFSHPVYRELREHTGLFAGVLAHAPTIVVIGEGGETRRAHASFVSADYFAVLGVGLQRGRSFSAAEGQPGANQPVVVVSHLHWQKTGFKPDIVGSTIRANGRLHTVIGVTPEGFSGTEMLTGPDFFLPLGRLSQADARILYLVARLQSGVSKDAAQAALKLLGENLERKFPADQKDRTLSHGPLPRLRTSPQPESELSLVIGSIVMLGLSTTVLLVVCLNLAGLQFSRGHARRKEFAIRLALGAGRGRIIRQLLTEGFARALIGGGLGLVCADWFIRLLAAEVTSQLPVSVVLTASATSAAALATVGFAGLATLFFVVGPALKLSRIDVLTGLKENAGEDTAGPRRRWLPGHPLMVVQISLTLALLICGGLFVRMADGVFNLDPGYDADHTLIGEVNAVLGNYDEHRSRQAYRAIEEKLAALPGVRAASIGVVAPFGRDAGGTEVQRAGAAVADGDRISARVNSIGANYFATMGIALLHGRTFTAAEAGHANGPPVAVIDATLARKLWPDGDALGQSIQFAWYPGMPRSRTMEIVGIVSSTRADIWDKDPLGAIFVPFAQDFNSSVYFHIRPTAPTAAAALALREQVRSAIQAAAPGVPVFSLHTFRAHRDSSVELWSLRLVMWLILVFGGATLLIATVGIYGIEAYAVSRRTREIGVRLALGADPARIRAMFFREGLVLALLSLPAGLLLGLGAGQILSSMVKDLASFDLLAFAIPAVAIVSATLLACYIPARRATQISPLTALRAE